MSREKKRGTTGNARAFITRAKALKKLQLSLPQFRRLCILKGVYPRDPRKKLDGSDKTYYLRKDIDFLAHDRLIANVRAQDAHRKKLVNARAKRRIDVLRRLARAAPKARLDHLVVERYPRFEDALRELDDPLCIVALFANLPADHKVGIAPHRVANCQRLLREFHNFVAQTRCLRRVFVSIKGYYFQARLSGELVTWITPHRFTQVLPADVDYSVMLTFLELYECIMSFVNFRLYTTRNLAYPPTILKKMDARALELASLKVEKVADQPDTNPVELPDQAVRAAEKAALAVAEEESDDEADDKAADPAGADEADAKQAAPEDAADDGDTNDEPANAVFAAKSIVLGREVPFVELEFALLSAGAAKVTREDDLPTGADRLKGYTHWIIDRPNIVGKRNMSLEYVQPQYVFDSINAELLLPTALYAPGANLPPHLSPFVTEEDDGGYRPWFKDVLERIKAGDSSVVAEAAAVVYAEGAARAKKEREIVEKSRAVAVASCDHCCCHSGNGKGDMMDDESAASGSDSEDADEQSDSDVGTAANDVEDGSDEEEDVDGSDTDEEENDEPVEEEDDEEDDDEGEEERMVKEKEAKLDKEGKEMATLMLSRKKMRQYKRHKREERNKERVKDKLTEKRKKLEEERAEVLNSKPTKKRRK